MIFFGLKISNYQSWQELNFSRFDKRKSEFVSLFEVCLFACFISAVTYHSCRKRKTLDEYFLNTQVLNLLNWKALYFMSNIAEVYRKKNALERARLQAVHLKAIEKKENGSQKAEENSFSGDHSNRFAATRRGVGENLNSTIKDAKKISKSMSVASLLKEANLLLDMPFVAAFGAAILKDALDLADFGTVVLPMLFSALCSLFIFMMLLLVGANGKRKTATKFFQKGLVILGGGLTDAIPGLDLLPVETATVLIIYLMTMRERAETRQTEAEERRMEDSLALQG